MKKKILSVLLIVVLFAAIPLTGCSSFSGVSVKGVQDTNYVVTGNGGNSVQYGDYIYFINGYKGYDDTDGKANLWKNVTKGALYRVKLLGDAKKPAEGSWTFNKTEDAVTGLEFEAQYFYVNKNEDEVYLSAADYTTLKNGGVLEVETTIESGDDDVDDEIVTENVTLDNVRYDVKNAELIAPKVIGTSGYADGGIFIYDNFVYYASPNNEKNKQGAVQSAKTDLYRTRLDGKVTQKLYTTKNDSASSPYKVYKQGKYTYFMILDGTDIISVKMNSSKAVSTTKLAENATALFLPDKPVYDSKNNSTNSIEDFVYYTRAITDEDGAVKAGNVIEMMRPDGSVRIEVLKNGKTSSIETVRDGLLFYRTVESGSTGTIIKFTNLHDVLLEHKITPDASTDNIDEIALASGVSDYTSTYCFRPDGELSGNLVYILGFTSSAIYLETNVKNTPRKKIYDGSVTFVGIYEGKIYFHNAENVYSYIDIDKDAAENTPVKIAELATTSGLKCDFTAGYFIYYGQVDNYANGYAMFQRLNGREGEQAVFIGERIKDDKKPEDDDK